MKATAKAISAILNDIKNWDDECSQPWFPDGGAEAAVRHMLKVAEPHLVLDKVKVTSHQCEAELVYGRCILPLGHNPILDGLAHVNGRGELFTLGDGNEDDSPRPRVRPLLDRQAVREEVRVAVNSAVSNGAHPANWSPTTEVERATAAVMELVQPMPTHKEIVKVIDDHYVSNPPTRDRIASAVLALLNGAES